MGVPFMCVLQEDDINRTLEIRVSVRRGITRIWSRYRGFYDADPEADNLTLVHQCLRENLPRITRMSRIEKIKTTKYVAPV